MQQRRGRMKKAILFAFALILISVGPAFASLIYDHNVLYSGSAPSGGAPWVTATFDTGSGPGTVDLTLAGVNLSSKEFVSSFVFNYTGSTPIAISTSWVGATASYSPNAYNGGGAGGFDIRILFPTGAQQNRFTNGSTAFITITGTSNPYDFYDTNAGPGIHGIYAGAHIQGITGLPGGPESSGWAAVPIPPTLWLLGAGLLGIVAVRRGFLK